MSRTDYEAISKIIEDILGKDTLTAVKILEGVKFYLDKKESTLRIVNQERDYSVKPTLINFKAGNESTEAMKRYTKKLRKESEKYKVKTKAYKADR